METEGVPEKESREERLLNSKVKRVRFGLGREARTGGIERD